mgnify:CR=1 FL=1
MQIGEFQSRPLGPFGLVGGGRMAPIYILVIEERLAGILEQFRHFPRMPRMHPVILGRGYVKRGRVIQARIEIVIGRDGLKEGAFFSNVRITIFINPGGAREQLVITQHVEQRHLDHHSGPQVRPLCDHDAHEQPAI